MNTIGETIKKCSPDVRNGLFKLFSDFGNLGNILRDEKAATEYHKLMVHVVHRREIELGNEKWNYKNCKFEGRGIEKIVKEYCGTIIFPLI